MKWSSEEICTFFLLQLSGLIVCFGIEQLGFLYGRAITQSLSHRVVITLNCPIHCLGLLHMSAFGEGNLTRLWHRTFRYQRNLIPISNKSYSDINEILFRHQRNLIQISIKSHSNIKEISVYCDTMHSDIKKSPTGNCMTFHQNIFFITK